MDFTRLKLVTEMYASAPGGGQGSLAGTKLTQAANNKASSAAQAPKAMTNTSNNVGFQQNQMAQKQGNVKAATVQKQGGAPAKQATTAGPQNVISHYDYFHALQKRKEFVKNLQEQQSDWRKELKEALGKDDEVFHPYVEVMPFKDFKQNEAKKNLAQQAGKKGAAENPAQVKAQSALMGMTNEGLEQDFAKEKQRRHDIGLELANREKKDKDKIAKRREMVDYTDYDGKYKGKRTSRNLGKK